MHPMDDIIILALINWLLWRVALWSFDVRGDDEE